MKVRRTAARIGLLVLAGAALAACAAGPTRAPTPAVVIARPEPPPTTVSPLAPAIATGEPWSSLTATFVMQDCAQSPLIRANAAMYTRSPASFERLLQQSLPLIMYVQSQLRDAGIPGEFAMLPMLESSYQPTARGRHGATGMWQMMPRTARLHGVEVTHGYDGRRDPVASTRAAVHMLQALEKRFDDWRLVDMAYNAGPYAVLGALRHHPDATASPVPDLPVSNTTRTHLARLMALSCILRQPERFDVELPKPRRSDQLIAVEVPADTRMDDAAQMARISESQLRDLNPGYTGKLIPAKSPRTLLLPVDAAESLAAALTVKTSESVARIDTSKATAGSDSRLAMPEQPARPDNDGTSAHSQRHHVRKGESLWSIAHRYHVSVKDLKRWNDLDSDTLRPGDVLDINGQEGTHQ